LRFSFMGKTVIHWLVLHALSALFWLGVLRFAWWVRDRHGQHTS
jgi:hypothetical protein